MRARLIILITLMMFMYGCAPGNVRSGAETTVARDAKAVELYNSGEYEQAAAEYLNLAQTYRDSTQRYLLSAADAYIQDRQYERAESLIGKLDPEPENIAERVYKDLLNARLALARNRAGQAEMLLQQEIPEDLPPALVAGWYDTLSGLYELQNRPMEALLSRIFLEKYLHFPARVDENSNHIWDLLNRIELSQISRAVPTAPVNLRPWIELASLNRALREGKTDPETALRTWSAAYPEHPANRTITSRILAANRDMRTLPAHIALLLPLTGAYQGYSERIRDGFLSAWFDEQSYKPVVRIYDTDATDFQQVYQRAIQSGADFVVGPLQKEAVNVLTGMQPVPVRTLALNQIEMAQNLPVNAGQTAEIPLIVQFGLPPEDEARAVARRGIQEGYTRVLIITAIGEFEDRIVNTFSEEWTRLGGRILERINYEGRTEDFITPVKQLLNIDSSEARIALLRQRLGRSLNVTGRLRNDADFIFMVAPNLTARQIVPHLRFFRAGNIPVYSVSGVYNGTPAPQSDADLNDVEFVDMPWLFGSAVNTGQGRPATADMSLPRYYAFGIDAFRLIPYLGQLAIDHNNRFTGATGGLYLTDQGMIRREPVWARFVDGLPQPIATGAQPR